VIIKKIRQDNRMDRMAGLKGIIQKIGLYPVILSKRKVQIDSYA